MVTGYLNMHKYTEDMKCATNGNNLDYNLNPIATKNVKVNKDRQPYPKGLDKKQWINRYG